MFEQITHWRRIEGIYRLKAWDNNWQVIIKERVEKKKNVEVRRLWWVTHGGSIAHRQASQRREYFYPFYTIIYRFNNPNLSVSFSSLDMMRLKCSVDSWSPFLAGDSLSFRSGRLSKKFLYVSMSTSHRPISKNSYYKFYCSNPNYWKWNYILNLGESFY